MRFIKNQFELPLSMSKVCSTLIHPQSTRSNYDWSI